MEQLLHYCWKHRMWPKEPLHTTDGDAVEVIDPGLLNRNAGPDFFNAKVKVGGALWVGNVELHGKASEWYQHGHDHDAAYDNVVLHVVEQADAIALTSQGRRLPQLVMSVPSQVSRNYEQLLRTDQYPPCYRVIPGLSRLMVHAWMAALQTERLEQKTQAIRERAHLLADSWEDAYFVTLARNYGFGINGDAFEQWAHHVSLAAAAKHRDDLFQVEALFLGQAGLLEPEAIPERHRSQATADAYYQRLLGEYRYLAHKFGLQPMDWRQWRYLRLRPQNFPQVRLSQLARFYCERRNSLSLLKDCRTADDVRQLMQTRATDYWQTHYAFGQESARNEKRLSHRSTDLLLINTAVPMLFAYGRHLSDEQLCDRAFDLLEQLKAEDNHVVRMWSACGLEAQSAGDSQALIQLKRQYCDRRDCLRCRFGYEYLKSDPTAMTREPDNLNPDEI